MFPYFYIDTPWFSRGAKGEAFASDLLLPLFSVQGPGNVAGSLRVFGAQPVIQNQAIPNAWNGLIAGQFVSQSLQDDSSGLSQ